MSKTLLLLAFSLVPAAHAAAFLITVNTLSINPTAGYLALDYSRQNAPPSFAAITGFTGASLGAVEPTLGTVSGDLSTNDLILTATNPGSNYAVATNFNTNSFSCLLSIYGPAIDTPDNGVDGTTFSIQMFDSGFSSGLLTVDGIVGQINIAGDGTITTDGLGFTTFGDPVPEPSTFLTMAAGIAALAFVSRRRV
jgi:hypothetical protein